MRSIARQVAAKASCRAPSFDFVRRRKSRKPAQPNGAKKPVARRVAAGTGSTRQAGHRAAAGEKVGDGPAVRAKHTTVIVDHEAALRVEQTWHHATDVKSPPERGECEVATAECIGLLYTRGPVVTFDRGRDGIRIEPMEPGEIRRGSALLYTAVIRELDEFLFVRRDVEDPLVEDREAGGPLRHHVRRVAGIAGALVTEAVAGPVDDHAALFDRRPRQKAAVRIGHC